MMTTLHRMQIPIAAHHGKSSTVFGTAVCSQVNGQTSGWEVQGGGIRHNCPPFPIPIHFSHDSHLP
eukprot:12613897-Prorocentrum_lima.AAC.1